MERLVNVQFSSLRETFGLDISSQEDGNRKVAAKLLNLYRTGRLVRWAMANIPVQSAPRSKTEINVNGYLIPKEWKVWAWIRSVRYGPEICPELLQFNPSRWDIKYHFDN
ncbi:Ent-kaurenoic acid oxidase 1-like protein [Drosera capensis]